MKCICCEKLISPLDFGNRDESEEELVFNGDCNKIMWNDGTVGEISAGYGSTHDGEKFVIAICDDCTTNKLDSGTLAYVTNYMFFDDGSCKEKKKLVWRRANNIKKLDI